jgi:hypothetical protein
VRELAERRRRAVRVALGIAATLLAPACAALAAGAMALLG